jgi:hypothetical protein
MSFCNTRFGAGGLSLRCEYQDRSRVHPAEPILSFSDRGHKCKRCLLTFLLSCFVSFARPRRKLSSGPTADWAHAIPSRPHLDSPEHAGKLDDCGRRRSNWLASLSPALLAAPWPSGFDAAMSRRRFTEWRSWSRPAAFAGTSKALRQSSSSVSELNPT